MLSLKIIWVQTNFGSEILGPKKEIGFKKYFGSEKNVCSEKKFGSLKNIGYEQNIGSQINFWSEKKFGSKRNVRSTKNSRYKKMCGKNFGSKFFLGLNEIVVQKNFGSPYN